MTFLNPLALWALGAMVVLFLLHLWRLRPVRRVMGSVRLWRRLTDRRPPVRALQRPKWSLLLLLQLLVLLFLIAAWAKPAIVGEASAPRKIALVFDTSASMAPQIDRAKEQAVKLLSLFGAADEVAVYARLPEPFVHRGDPREGIRRVRVVPCEIDVSEVIRAVDADYIYVFTDEPVDVSEKVRVIGAGPRTNTGIVYARMEKDALFVRIAHVGVRVRKMLVVESRGKIVHSEEIAVDEKGLTRTLPRGDRVRLEPTDAFPMDDVAGATPGGPLDVVLHGKPDPRFLRALATQDNLRVAADGDVHIHFRTTPRTLTGFRIVIDPQESFGNVTVGPRFVPDRVTLGNHELLRSVEPQEVVAMWAREVRFGGTVLMSIGGQPVAVAGKNLVVVGLEWRSDGWPVYPSFPIFWTNVIRYARSSTPGGARFLRTCEGTPKPVGSQGDAFYNLLSERETRSPGLAESIPDSPPKAGRVGTSTPFDGILLIGVLALLILSWIAARE